MKHLVGKVQTKQVSFAGDTVEIIKLSIQKVKNLQEVIAEAAKSEDQLEVLRRVLRLSVVGAEDMTDEDFDTFAPDDLANLTEEVFAYIGISTKEQSGN